MTFLLAYFGPETTLPVVTVVASAIGIVMVVAKASMRRIKNVARLIRKRKRADP